MGLLTRWRKRPDPILNSIVIDAHMIREIIEDNLIMGFGIGSVLHDYVRSLPDEDLDYLGEAIAHDGDVWDTVVDAVLSYTLSMRFQELLEEGGLE